MAPKNPLSHAKSPAVTRNVKHVVLGDLLFQTWYQSIYPEDLVSKDTDRLYVCRWCFRYSCDADAYANHTRACLHRTTPPGSKVYDHGGYSVWEVDGEYNKLYAQNLSLFAKLFLDHKSVFFDVFSFLYYLLVYTNPEDSSYHVLGFFSKEKLSWDANNLACILVFPPYQHKQLGKLLMGVSYKLSGWEHDPGLIGGPEKPLSEMGSRSYSRFWEERIARYILLRDAQSGDAQDSPQQKQKTPKGTRKRPPHEIMTVQDIGLATGMLTEDVITALKGMGAVETATPSKKRKMPRTSTDGPDESEPVIIRKSKILEWAKAHKTTLDDPIKDDGFVGEWAPKGIKEVSLTSDEEGEGEQDEQDEKEVEKDDEYLTA
ncbi:acyl-CoA N-acyltransferase [Aspergillus steynii IBT 23096]|uniref:histone acetyltransferase n=1 Tax=Aspergillus steynii IBT 23096 TaxID=1392250 RepID=A0A2I2GJM9_9EURO|nr:acyl-CoA N-acyltransferase [Aspergillus steynii IBT 23096]PLB53088.1 acyl-CoA N-acyltransferase [Aspergillus steynii IBT 23096]